MKLYRQRQMDCGAAGQPWDPAEMPSIPYVRKTYMFKELDADWCLCLGALSPDHDEDGFY